jgi:hypothetical protein
MNENASNLGNDPGRDARRPLGRRIAPQSAPAQTVCPRQTGVSAKIKTNVHTRFIATIAVRLSRR